MPALQSFSLPRSGPRVTARPCPPVVPRQRRRDYEAFFRSEIRDSDGSWPNRTARCSPGLPRLEPHPNATPSGMPERAAMRGAEDPHAGGPIRWPCPRLQCHHCPKAGHTVCAGEDERDGITAAPDARVSGPSAHHRSGVLAGLSPGRTVVLPSRSRGAPRVRRLPARWSARRRTHKRHPRCPGLPCRWRRSPKRSLPSARLRSVRSAAAVEGVHVADGLIGSRSVTRGRAIGAKTPASARRRKVPPYVSPGVRPVAPTRIAAQRGPAGTSGVTCSKL
jgi:hypothetical protein